MRHSVGGGLIKIAIGNFVLGLLGQIPPLLAALVFGAVVISYLTADRPIAVHILAGTSFFGSNKVGGFPNSALGRLVIGGLTQVVAFGKRE